MKLVGLMTNMEYVLGQGTMTAARSDVDMSLAQFEGLRQYQNREVIIRRISYPTMRSVTTCNCTQG